MGALPRMTYYGLKTHPMAPLHNGHALVGLVQGHNVLCNGNECLSMAQHDMGLQKKWMIDACNINPQSMQSVTSIS